MVLAKAPDRIVDREREIGTLVSDLAESSKNINYGLIGFRRIGKTTILQEVAKQLTSKGLIVVSIDFSLRKYDPAGFFKDMLNETSRGYYRVAGKKEQVLDDVRAGLNKLKDLTRARVRLEISVDQTTGSPTITPMPYLKEAERDYSILFRSTFEYVSQIAERSERRVVVMLDEFQTMAEWKRYAGLEAITEHLKHVIEARGNVCYVVSGSRAHFMRNLLSSGGSPLFGLFNIMEISYLDEGSSKELFKMNDPSASDREAKEAYDLVSGHPFYLIALATSRRKGETVKGAYLRSITSAAGSLNLYVKYVLTEDTGTYAKGPIMSQVLRALAGQPMSVGELARVAEVKLTSLPKFLNQLIEMDLVKKEGKVYSLVDRVVADYLKLNP
ncbi:MAG: ATP-binding protein [Nitrososphaerales archaeon]|jgi:AAA+ ATPase superfamily predicted ATPase